MRKIYFLLACALFLAGCASEPIHLLTSNPSGNESTSPERKVERIRVAILLRQSEVRLAAPESFVLSGFPLSATPAPDSGADRTDVQKRVQEAVLRPGMLYSHKAFIEPLGEGEIQVNGKKYKGAMEILEDGQGTLTVINDLLLEDYVMGVLAGEVPRDWPASALEAQAIAARTFAVLKRSQAREKGEPFDLENTSLFQVYGGSDLVNDNIRKAVSRTQGEIATYKEAPIEAYFHSNCGGKTCGSKEVWSKDEPYLAPVDCPYGNSGAHFRWKAEIPIRDLVNRLRKAGVVLADVVSIKPLDEDNSGRVARVSIMDAEGQVHSLKATAFRMALGPDLVKSTRFQVEITQDRAVFSGKGWGHGVGLCQEGACGMALKGYNAFEILRHYYKGIMIEKIKD